MPSPLFLCQSIKANQATYEKRTIRQHDPDIASKQSRKSNRAQESLQNQQRPTDHRSQINTNPAFTPSLNSGKLERQGLNKQNHLELKCLDCRQLSLSESHYEKTNWSSRCSWTPNSICSNGRKHWQPNRL